MKTMHTHTSTRTLTIIVKTIATIGLLSQFCSAQIVVDFEELNAYNGTPPSGTGEYFNGYGFGATSAGFRSKIVEFETAEFGPGWSYSNVNNTSTPGFTNQFAAFPGGGSGAAGTAVGTNYGLVFTGSGTLLDGTPTNGSRLTFDHLVELQSVDVSNTTYVAQYALNGLDGFGSPDFNAGAQFGDGDFFRLRITGFDNDGNQTGLIDFDLANYGGAGTADDHFLADWATIDLSGFGQTRSLVFSTTSSQISDFGAGGVFSDVPSYAAIDNLTFAVPEPGCSLILFGGALLVGLRRKRAV